MAVSLHTYYLIEKMNCSAATQSQVALHLMIDHLAQAVRKKTIHTQIVNAISPDLSVNTGTQAIAAVIETVMTAALPDIYKGLVRISAKKYSNVVLLHFKGPSALEYPAAVNCLSPFQELVKKLTGHLSVTSRRNDITTVALTFINNPLAA